MLAAGLFTLLLGAAVAAAVWWFSDDSMPVKPLPAGQSRQHHRPERAGPGAFRGIQAGKVESIRIDPDNPREILVQISLREDLPVTRGTTASLGYQASPAWLSYSFEDRGADLAPLVADDGTMARIELEPGLLDKASDVAPRNP